MPGISLADDLVEREFSPDGPNVPWIADVTYLRTREGWRYLAAVQDAYTVGSPARAWPSRCPQSSASTRSRRPSTGAGPQAGLVHHGLLRKTAKEPRASLAFGGTLMTATLTLFPVLGRTSPPWRRPPSVVATAFGAHAADVGALAACTICCRRCGVFLR